MALFLLHVRKSLFIFCCAGINCCNSRTDNIPWVVSRAGGHFLHKVHLQQEVVIGKSIEWFKNGSGLLGLVDTVTHTHTTRLTDRHLTLFSSAENGELYTIRFLQQKGENEIIPSSFILPKNQHSFY